MTTIATPNNIEVLPADCAMVRELIITNILRRGHGKDETSPVRIITQVWNPKNGSLLFEEDPCAVVLTREKIAQIEAFLAENQLTEFRQILGSHE